MKKIEVEIGPFKLEEVGEVLEKNGITKFRAAEVKVFGLGGHAETYRGSEFNVDYLPRCVVSFVADDEKVNSLIEAITQVTRTRGSNNTNFIITPVERYIDLAVQEQSVETQRSR